MCAFFWFLLHMYITRHGSKKVNISAVSTGASDGLDIHIENCENTPWAKLPAGRRLPANVSASCSTEEYSTCSYAEGSNCMRSSFFWDVKQH